MTCRGWKKESGERSRGSGEKKKGNGDKRKGNGAKEWETGKMKGFRPVERKEKGKTKKWIRKLVWDQTRRWMVRGRKSEEEKDYCI